MAGLTAAIAIALQCCDANTDASLETNVATGSWFIDRTADVGLNFTYQSGAAGRFHLPEIMGAGVGLFDYDNDGDLDLVVSNVESAARVYYNEAPRDGHWLRVRVVDPKVSRDAIGSRLTVVAGGRTQVRTTQSALGYLSASDPRAHFGVSDRVEDCLVRWPDGQSERFSIACVDCDVVLIRGTGEVLP